MSIIIFPAVIVIILEFAAFAAPTVILLQIICARRSGEFFSLTQSATIFKIAKNLEDCSYIFFLLLRKQRKNSAYHEETVRWRFSATLKKKKKSTITRIKSKYYKNKVEMFQE